MSNKTKPLDKWLISLFINTILIKHNFFYHNKCDTVYLLFFPPYTTKLD